MFNISEYRFALLLLSASTLIHGCNRETGTDTLDSFAMEVPAASGSMSPNLAAGPDDGLILSWLEPDESGHRLRYSVLEGERWGSPGTVARGDNWFVNWADFPSVVPISESLRAAHWLVRQPAGGYAYDVLFSLSRDGGDTWSEAVKPHDDGTPTEHGFVTVFPHDTGVGLVWLDGRNMSDEWAPDGPVKGMTLRAATFAEDMAAADQAVIDALTCDCCQTDVAVTDTGPVAVYRDRSTEETRDIYISRHTNGGWQAGRPVANDGWVIGGCPVNGPVIAANGDHLAVAWFTAANEQPRVRVARSRDGGDSFQPPLEISDGETFGRAGIAMLDDGDLAVSWLCKADDESARVCLRRVFSDDRLGPVHIPSGDDNVPAFSVPQLARSGEFLIAAWTVSDGDSKGIKGSRIAIGSLR
jgi:hypothetical protein